MPEIDLFHLRITYKEVLLADIITFIIDNAEPLVITHEVSKHGVPHIHCVLLGFKQTKSTFFQKFHKLCPTLIGNGSYMCQKKKDREAQLRYCCKGSETELPDVRFSDKTIDTKFYYDEFWKENSLLKAKTKEVNMGLQKDSSLVPKVKSKTWTERTFDEMRVSCAPEIRTIRGFKRLYTPTEKEIKTEEIAQQTCFKFMLKCLGKGAKKIDNHILFSMFNGFINAIYCMVLDDENDLPLEIHSMDLFKVYLDKRKMEKSSH